jgi:hypothetical protein
MNSSWGTAEGRLVCRWSEVGKRIAYTPDWVPQGWESYCGYLLPVPDFAAHSPFGAADWFEPHWVHSLECESRW